MSTQPTIVVEADPELVVEEQEVLIEVSPLPGPPGPPGVAEGFDEAMAAAAAAQATADTALSGLSGKQDASTAATDAELAAGLATRQATSEKGQASGYASLDGGGKVPASQLPNSVMEFQGMWDPSTNSPVLADGTGNPGDVYRCSATASRNLGSGSIAFKVNDQVLYGADGKWYRSRATDDVTSVAGKTGDVTLGPADVGAAAASHTHTLSQISDAGAAAAKAVTTDTALGGNSDANLPTEKAVRGYVTTQAGLLIPTSAIETDATLPSNSDSKVPSSKAMKTALAGKRSLSKWRPLGHKIAGAVGTGLSSGNKYWLIAGANANVNLAVATAASNTPNIFNWVPGDHSESGLTTKLLLRVLEAHGTAPGLLASITFSLYTITYGSNLTLNSAATGSSVSLGTNTANTGTINEVEFDAPAADLYAIGFTLLGTPAAAFHAEAELFVRNV